MCAKAFAVEAGLLPEDPRLAIPGTMLCILGFQTFLASFALSLLQLARR